MVAYVAYLMKGGSSGDMKTMSVGARRGSKVSWEGGQYGFVAM